MWLWLSLIALLCWSGSDLFSKIGCRDGSDRYSHLKMVIAVGVVMGLHAAFEIFVGGTAISWSVIWTYLPVSLLYISSMALGYLGLRYIELSVSSPICNSSGALVAVLTLLFVGGEDYSPLALLALYSIDPAKCKGCSKCARNCPVNAISGVVKKPYTIDSNKCIKCGACKENCAFDAIYIEA